MIGSHGFCSADLHLYDFCLHFPCSKFCNLSHGFKTYGIDNHTCPWILLPDDMQNIRKASTASPNKYMCRRFQGFQYFRCFPIHRNHICQMKFFQIPAQKLLGMTCGVFGEPAGVTGTAAVKKACELGLIEKGATVVSVVTGNGLKDVANAIKSAGEPINIKPDLDLMVEEFVKRGVTVE